MNMKHPKKPYSTAWLWWLAFLILSGGGSATYYFYLDRVNPSAYAHMQASLLFTIIATGICIISATANLWLRR